MSTWVRTGTVAVTNGSTTVTGTGTAWVDTVNVGDAFHGPDGRVYEIASVVSATQLTLATTYLGTTASAQGYAIQPTRSVARQLVQEVQQLLTDFSTVRDNAGQGRFAVGSLGAPGISFLTDLDTGMRRSANNRVSMVGGGLDLLEVGDGYSAGAAVQASSTDKSANKLMRLVGSTGAFGLGGTNLPALSDANALLNGGTGFYQAFDDLNMPTTGAYVLLHMDRTANATAIQLALRWYTTQMYMRSYNAGWTAWRRFLSEDDRKPPITVTIADDAVAAIDLGGWFGVATLVVSGSPTSPSPVWSQQVFLDAGSTPAVTPMSSAIGGLVEAATGVLVAGGGTDTKVTIATHTDGYVRISNRTGSSLTFTLDFGGKG